MTYDPKNADDIERRTKEKFDGGFYNKKIASNVPTDEPSTFSERLLHLHMDTIRRHTNGNSIVMDLCCATGEHLFALSDEVARGVGVDFSQQYLEEASQRHLRRGAANIDLVLASARSLPFKNDKFDLVYSLSSLHVIPRVMEVIGEVSRVLKPGGIFLGDFGNIHSLNQIVCKHYPELAEPCFMPANAIRKHLEQARFTVLQQRCFQILPLWGQRPQWLKPLLWPGWEKLARRQFGGKMLDERISSLPGLRRLAFRQVFVCSKV